MLMMSINYTSSSCELNNPPKTSPKCIRNSTVHYEVLAMCFIKRTHLNLSTNSQGERGECCCCCCCHLRKQYCVGCGVCKSLFCTWQVWRALKRLKQLLRFFRALQTSPRALYLEICTLTHAHIIVNSSKEHLTSFNFTSCDL